MTHEELKELLHYAPKDGLFYWRAKFCKKVVVGSVAGTINGDGYRVIRIAGAMYRANRLAWFYMTGAWPDAEVDHVNGVRDDDHWGNLRACTSAENRQNRALAPGRGFFGCTFNKRCRKWHAKIKKNRRTYSLGYYQTAEEAFEAYKRGKAIHHEFSPELRVA